MKIQKLPRLYIIFFALLMLANLSMAEIQRWTCQSPSIKEFPSVVKEAPSLAKEYMDDVNVPISFDYDTSDKKLLSVSIFRYENNLQLIQYAPNIYRAIGNLDEDASVFYILDWFTTDQKDHSGNRLYGHFAISKHIKEDEAITDQVVLKGCTYTVLKEAEHKKEACETSDCENCKDSDSVTSPLVPKKSNCCCTVS